VLGPYSMTDNHCLSKYTSNAKVRFRVSFVFSEPLLVYSESKTKTCFRKYIQLFTIHLLIVESVSQNMPLFMFKYTRRIINNNNSERSVWQIASTTYTENSVMQSANVSNYKM